MIHSIQLLSHIDSIITAAIRIYAIGGEIFSITAILVALNFIATAIQRTYQAGYQVGKFYRSYLHKPLKWLVIHAIALVILLTQLAWEGCQVIWSNRQEIYDACNDCIKLINQAWSYRLV